MPVIETATLRVDCIDEGAGPVVVLAHSSVSGNRQWRRLIERLRDRHRVIAPNLLGYGQTTPWTVDGTQTLADAAAVLHAVIDAVPQPVTLVGHSWGGACALAAASAAGEAISHVVVHEPMLPALLRNGGRDAACAEASALHADVKRLGGAGDWAALAARFTDYFNGDGSWERTPDDRRRAVAGALLPNYFEWDAATQPMDAHMFGDIRARTLVVRGTATRPLLAATVDVLLAAHPHWALAEMTGAGHMAPLAMADGFNAIVERFIAA